MNALVRRLIVLFALALGIPAPAGAQYAFNTTWATGVAIEGVPLCLNWCVVGVCYFLVPNCTPVGCFPTIETTARIKHKSPDVIVSSWTAGPNPYLEGAALYDIAAAAAGGSMMAGVLGGGEHIRRDSILTTPDFGDLAPKVEADQAVKGTGDQEEQQRSTHLRFKHTAVIGHPMTAVNQGGVFGAIGANIPGMCPSEAIPMLSYYHSDFDAINWRTGLTDLLHPMWLLFANVPGLSEVGLWPLNVYGPRFPRTGFVNQYSDYMSAAVAADRAMHIVTRLLQWRIYVPLYRPDLPADVKAPGESIGDWLDTIGNSLGLLNGPWQMVLPLPDPSCNNFGLEMDLGRGNDSGRYAWNYWQSYECCLTRNGIYLGSVNATELVCMALGD